MSRSQVREVASREIRTRSRTKAFRVITGILMAAAVIGPIAAAAWPGDDESLRQVTIGYDDVDAATRGQIVAFARGVADVTFEDLSGSAPDEVEAALADGAIDVAIEPGPTLVWDTEVDLTIAGIITAPLQQRGVIERGQTLGLSEADLVGLLDPVPIGQRFVDESDSSDDLATVVAYLGLLSAFLIPQVFGQLTLMSVVEEKATRVIEILLSHVKPRTLLLGKVLGLGSLALVQLVVIVAGLTAALALTDAIDVPASVWRFVPIILVSIIGGLAIYNTTFALLGSLISRQEDASQVMLPLFIPLMGGFFVGQAAVFGNAESPVVRVLTWFPLTAPMLLPVRVALDAIPAWEIALSLALLGVSVWALIRLAGRIYEFTLLHTGARVGWGDVLRLSRGATLD